MTLLSYLCLRVGRGMWNRGIFWNAVKVCSTVKFTLKLIVVLLHVLPVLIFFVFCLLLLLLLLIIAGVIIIDVRTQILCPYRQWWKLRFIFFRIHNNLHVIKLGRKLIRFWYFKLIHVVCLNLGLEMIKLEYFFY